MKTKHYAAFWHMECISVFVCFFVMFNSPMGFIFTMKYQYEEATFCTDMFDSTMIFMEKCFRLIENFTRSRRRKILCHEFIEWFYRKFSIEKWIHQFTSLTEVSFFKLIFHVLKREKLHYEKEKFAISSYKQIINYHHRKKIGIRCFYVRRIFFFNLVILALSFYHFKMHSLIKQHQQQTK